MNPFPTLDLSTWRETRDALATCAQFIGAIRGSLMPRQRHWAHHSLFVSATGLTTMSIPLAEKTFAVNLDLVHDRAIVQTSNGESEHFPLTGRASEAICADIAHALHEIGCSVQDDHRNIFSAKKTRYISEHAHVCWQALSRIDMVMKTFKGQQRNETSPVQLWPHHFDLALLWFSGRLVPHTYSKDEDQSDEQMNFGFSTGDDGIPEAYFYITAYPFPEKLALADLPEGAYWHSTGWNGAVLPYRELMKREHPDGALLDFFKTVHRAGSDLMR